MEAGGRVEVNAIGAETDKRFTYVRADLILQIAILVDFLELLLLLFFGAGADGSRYSMLVSFPSVNCQLLVASIPRRGHAVHWPLRSLREHWG